MADIAILVAEEYERRVKSSRKIGEEIELFSCVGVLGQKFKGSSSSWIKEKILLVKEEKMMKNLEPRSQMTVAATNGFFSA
ncbi:hypothetical protein C2S52_009360 [Perilla frutescens var. hirtella]|uniref:Uncharacterized protein n=1 Tax=Perilla frutescens var. hirtella TaxID=608512 RepID=A0AAD4JB65_PERFH|nr:hypothetical protein C2S51_017146 [Perilla frutescens var. frutescens]KAH6784401.1 hypothetical protein C2S52_009360 [Perilla frutescens var. hirtella]KAH6830578.1 hypothetical protein C2S53_015329 [Perilla frutescens var. hirtella]